MSLLTELLQGYRRPAVAITDNGSIVCSSPAAMRIVDHSGCTDKQIASQTGLSFSTVRTYVRQIYRRLNVHTRVELVNLSLARE